MKLLNKNKKGNRGKYSFLAQQEGGQSVNLSAPIGEVARSAVGEVSRRARAGFTLAEVLITIGIIGVVSALTIPQLMTAYKKHVIATSLKKGVSVINQTIKQSEAENGEMETWDKTTTQDIFIDKYIRPYMRLAATCPDVITDCGYKGTNGGRVWKQMNNIYDIYRNPNGFGRIPFLTMDGILYTFAYVQTDENLMADNDKTIIIDINGPKGPNQFGQDVFFLYRNEEADSIIPYGADKPIEEVQQDCSKNGKGLYCATLIYQNGWNIPKGYPIY
jgi:prepilin-type N-terminal cleavage/methylation domain-containing protein